MEYIVKYIPGEDVYSRGLAICHKHTETMIVCGYIVWGDGKIAEGVNLKALRELKIKIIGDHADKDDVQRYIKEHNIDFPLWRI